MLKIDIISRERIKPSSPTPLHLRTHKLSLLDQFIPPYFVPIILYYSHDKTSTYKQSSMACCLKRSLSEALTLYYPIAGRMKGESSVDCNDEGVDYLEARVDSELSKFIKPPQVEILSQLLPRMNIGSEETSDEQLAIQLNLFSCGGIAIGICISHRIADGSTLSSFVQAWAALTRGETDLVVSPSFDSVSLFPPRDPLGYKQRVGISKGTLVTRRFDFNGSQLATLKAKIVSADQVNTLGLNNVFQPTRVELVTALIWKYVMSSHTQIEKIGSSVVNHSVNLRGRMDPPLPEYSFGNLFRSAYAFADGGEVDLASMVSKLREGIGEINSEYIKKLQGENGYAVMMDRIKMVGELLSNKGVKMLLFSSWCRFPFYEVDFGWGKPVWVSCVSRAAKNCIILMDSKCDDGIEAWITMEEEDMVKLEQNPQLLAFSSST